MDYNNFVQPAIWAAVVIASLAALRLANIFIYIPKNQVGIVEKLWTTRGSIKAGFIALRGEAGFEPEVLRGGLHLFFPFMYRIHRSDLVTVGQGKIAYVFARDGAPLRASQVLGADLRADETFHNNFQEPEKFLAAAVGEQSRLEGQGEADRVLAVGAANAQATKLSVDAYGGPEFRLAEQNFAKFSEALTKINQPLVPQFLMSGAQGQENNSAGLIPTAMLSSMFGRMMPDALEKLKDEAPPA